MKISSSDFFLNIQSMDYCPPKKVLEFSKLQTGWHFGEGKPITKSIIDTAIIFDKEAYDNKLFETDFFPGINGEILIAIYQDIYYMELIIEENDSITYCLEKNNIEQKYKENLSFEDAKQTIVDFKELLWKLSVSSTVATGILENEDSKALPSKIQVIMGESPLSANPVLQKPKTLFVSTSKNIMQRYLQNPQSTGQSEWKSYLKLAS